MSGVLHDFKKPRPLAAELEVRLSSWLRAAMALLPERMARHIVFPIQFSYRSIETSRGGDFFPKLTDEDLGHRLVLEGSSFVSILVSSRRMALALVAGMLGEECKELPADRSMTELETAVFDLFLDEWLGAMAEAWPEVPPPALSADGLEQRIKRTRAIRPDQNIVVCGVEVSSTFGSSMCNWVLPQDGLGGLLSISEPAIDHQSVRPTLELLARQIPVTISVRLGQAELPVSDLAGLAEGDLIFLDQKITDPMVATIQGGPTFTVRPGRAGVRKAIQITSWIEV